MKSRNQQEPIVDFLYEPRNSKVKESIFNDKLFCDLKLAAAKSKRRLQVFVPEVDMDGTDVVLELESNSRSMQLKTSKTAGAHSWEIHPHLILPKYTLFGSLMSEICYGGPAPDTIGLGGGFILIQPVFENNEVSKVNYFFTDIALIYLFSEGIIDKKGYRACQKHASDSLTSAYKNTKNEKMKVHMSSMIPLANKESLLEIALITDINSAIANNLSNRDRLVLELEHELGTLSDKITIQ